MNIVDDILFNPFVAHDVLRKVCKRLRWGSYSWRLAHSAVDRPHYGYCLFQAAMLAQALGHQRISVIEYGVAGGRGLLSLEAHAEEISRILPVTIEIYGFDTGKGLPPPKDFRDLPYHWQEGFFQMDEAALRARLKKARLVLGDIRETVGDFFARHNPAPVGAVMFDFDYYSSTMDGLRLFDGAPDRFLPRVFCYLDDINGSEVELYNDHTGVRLSVHEFNEAHEDRKIALPWHLLTRRYVERWYHQIRVAHFFAHPLYNRFISTKAQQLPLAG